GETETTTETTTGETETTTGGDTTTGGEESTTTGDETTGGMSACLEVSIDGPFVQNGAAYVASSFTPLGDADIEDVLRVEFYDFVDGPLPEDGVDLASAGLNDNYVSCDECFRALEDGGITVPSVRGYFQSQGTLTASEPVAAGTASLTFAGVRLIEVTVADDFTSTPVEDGACIDIVDGTYLALPPTWTCDPVAFGDGAVCDCGCGVVDPDCADATAASCDACNGAGSCAEAAMDCSPVADDDNSICPPNALCVDDSVMGELDAADGTFNRTETDVAMCTLDPESTEVSFEVQTFAAPAGLTNLEVSTCNTATFDTFLAIYQAADGSADPFDSLDPCTNLVAVNDDGPGCAGFSSLAEVNGLIEGEYQVVVTQYNNSTPLGTYTLDLTCI
ncbi:MAG: hypothetical protein KUG77_15520, partial [Nannocystaceae bacterium]|nr:hypothetical protein [Nannocystaceae bacterium]